MIWAILVANGSGCESKHYCYQRPYYDDTGYGAVLDNATGVALLLETARLIANTNCDAEISFVLFSGEENDLILATLDGNGNQASSLFETFLQGQELQIVKAPPSDYVSFAMRAYKRRAA